MTHLHTDLPVRAQSKVLCPRTDTSVPMSHLLDVGARAGTWRIIELFSRSGTPFEADVAWSAGAGVGSHAAITVAHAARLCVFARGLQVRVKNLGSTKNSVGVTVADGFSPTRNQYEVCGLSERRPVQMAIPPFADHFRVDLDDRRGLRRVQIRVRDGADQIYSHWIGLNQPDSGIPVGGAGSLELLLPPAHRYRVVFTLTL